MKCKCGNTMSNTMCPNTLEGDLKGSYEYKDRNVWECDQCGRLHIDIDDPDVKGCHITKSYIPEDGKVGNLFDIGYAEQYEKYIRKLWSWNKDAFQTIIDDSVIIDKVDLMTIKSISEVLDKYMKK